MVPQASERRGSASRTASPPTPTSALARENLPALALLLLVLAGFYPAFSAGFVWDDNVFIARAEAVLDWSGLFWLWFEPSRLTREPHYWPLAFSTFWLEHKLWGLDPIGYHIVNVALHGINAVLLWRILTRLELPGAWLAAALFAVHPMQAEAVTWVMGRKDLLSTLFYLTAAGCWLRYRRRPRTGTMVLTLLLFAAGMLSKSMVITLPAALLLCVWWKDGRISLADLKQVLPLFAVGAGIASIDLVRYSSLASHDIDYSWLERLLISCRALWFYALKPLWPDPLPVIYPHWDTSSGNPLNWLCLAGAAAVAATLWLLRSRIGRGPLAGALFFAVTLSPVLGFGNNVFMGFSFVADRYQYLAGVGLKAVLAGGLVYALGKAGPRAVFAGRFAAALLLALCAGLAMRHAMLFRNEISFYSHIVALNPTAHRAQYNLGVALADEGRAEESLPRYDAAIEQESRFADAHFGRAKALGKLGRYGEARAGLERALELDPNDDRMHGEIGWVLLKLQRYAEAEAHLRRAAKANPADGETLQNLAESLRAQGRFEEAASRYEAVIELDGGDGRAHAGRAMALGQLGRYEEARAGFERALAAAPELETLLADLPVFRRAMGLENR